MSPNKQMRAANSAIRLTIGALALLAPFYCHATDVLDCTGTPYSISMIVGYGENGEDYLSEITLHQDGQSERIAFYDHDNLIISLFKWEGKSFANLVDIATKADVKPSITLRADNESATMKVDEKEYALSCFWER